MLGLETAGKENLYKKFWSQKRQTDQRGDELELFGGWQKPITVVTPMTISFPKLDKPLNQLMMIQAGLKLLRIICLGSKLFWRSVGGRQGGGLIHFRL